MKMVLVSDTPVLKPFLERSFGFRRADVIHYDNPIKAMDNLEEIRPEIVFFSATDFPRHWKPFVMYLRNTFSHHETVFILLIGDAFTDEEAQKADHLDVNAVLDEDLTKPQTLERVRGIIARYHRDTDIRRDIRYLPSPTDAIWCAFTNPHTFRFVYCDVIDISDSGLRLRPIHDVELSELKPHSVLTMVSLQLGGSIVPVLLKIIRITEMIGCEYVDLSADSDRAIVDYIQKRVEQYPLGAS